MNTLNISSGGVAIIQLSSKTSIYEIGREKPKRKKGMMTGAMAPQNFGIII